MSTPDEAIAPENLSLDGVVVYWASQRPESPALEYPGESGPDRLTWSQFNGLIAGAAHQIARYTAPGQVIAIVCSDTADFHILVNALWRLGSSVLLIDRTWGPAIVADLLKLTNCAVLFHDNWSLDWGDCEPPLVLPYPSRLIAEGNRASTGSSPNTIALYATTSGTTSNPKCVAISHRRIRTAYRTCLRVHDLSRVRMAGCLFHLNSLGVMGVCFLLPREVGAATRAFPAFTMANIQTNWKALLSSDTDFVYLVPPLVRLLNKLSITVERARPILAFCAAAPVREHELRALEAKMPLRVYNNYGLTELTFAVFFGCREEGDLASESIGYPVGLDARLVDDDGHIIGGTGTGELHVRAPMLTDGYLRNPDATAVAWVENGWFKTGDIAERDEAGRYYIRGRKKDVVLRGGVTYYLYEIEHYLRRAPGVVDVCAFRGRELPSGDELCVVAQVSRPTDQEALLDWIRRQMGPSKLPNALYVWTNSLPRNSNGKILQQILLDHHLRGTIQAAGNSQ